MRFEDIKVGMKVLFIPKDKNAHNPKAFGWPGVVESITPNSIYVQYSEYYNSLFNNRIIEYEKNIINEYLDFKVGIFQLEFEELLNEKTTRNSL